MLHLRRPSECTTRTILWCSHCVLWLVFTLQIITGCGSSSQPKEVECSTPASAAKPACTNPDVAQASPKRRRVFVIRHGVKEENRPDRDNFELSLTPEGLEALASLNAFLKKEGISFKRSLCSPYLRTRQTSKAICDESLMRVEPGCSEALDEAHGLRDGSGGSELSTFVAKVHKVMASEGIQGVPSIVSTEELQREVDNDHSIAMERTALLVERLKESDECDDLLIVSHGSPAYGIIQAFITGSAAVFNKADIPLMGGLTQLEEVDGSWKIVRSVVPVRTEGGWHCNWKDGAATGADVRDL